MLLWENMKLALSAIKANKMRSFLTMLGIIIGIGAVISIVSIGDTMRLVIAKEYENVGLGRAVVYVSNTDEYRESDYFTLDDLNYIQQAFAERIEAIDPGISTTADLTRSRTTLRVNFTGVPGNYGDVQPLTVLYGRMINQNDVDTRKNYIVLERQTAEKFFGKENATGETMRAVVYGEIEEFLVVGIYQKQQSLFSALFSGNAYDESYVPYTMLAGPDDTFFFANLYAAKDADFELLKTQLTGLVARMKNRDVENIAVYSAQEEMSMLDNIMRGMSAAVGAIAAISLLVGGIGIMNIMLVSVTERTREIGIRKALGARTRDIMVQFLIESALLSAAGGIIGVFWGVGMVVLGGFLLGVGVAVSPVVVLGAVGFSALVGIFFGIYPASRAAKADPIKALRYE